MNINLGSLRHGISRVDTSQYDWVDVPNLNAPRTTFHTTHMHPLPSPLTPPPRDDEAMDLTPTSPHDPAVEPSSKRTKLDDPTLNEAERTYLQQHRQLKARYKYDGDDDLSGLDY